MRGVIPHTPSTDDQLQTRILALLDPALSPSTINFIDPENAVIAADTAPSTDPEARSNFTASSPHPEILGAPVPVPTPSTPGTPSTEASDHESQQRASGGDDEVASSTKLNSEQQAASETAVPGRGSSQSTNDLTNPTSRQDWTRTQRERERQLREERERIRAQIKHDHAERRRLEELRRQPAIDLTSHDSKSPTKSPTKRPGISEIRVQVRTFDGSTLRSTFAKNATVTGQIRPWIDRAAGQSTPYSLKIVLTPLPNRTIEAAEEAKSLEDLDIINSCTLVMVPVRGFVESYAPPGSGIIGSAVSGGYNLLSGSVGAVFGGVRSVLGFGQVTAETPTPSAPVEALSRPPTGQVRVRTLADQRMDAQSKDHQFYNGNQLNFEPRKDEEDDDKKD
jgi:UBX domain